MNLYIRVCVSESGLKMMEWGPQTFILSSERPGLAKHRCLHVTFLQKNTPGVEFLGTHSPRNFSVFLSVSEQCTTPHLSSPGIVLPYEDVGTLNLPTDFFSSLSYGKVCLGTFPLITFTCTYCQFPWAGLPWTFPTCHLSFLSSPSTRYSGISCLICAYLQHSWRVNVHPAAPFLLAMSNWKHSCLCWFPYLCLPPPYLRGPFLPLGSFQLSCLALPVLSQTQITLSLDGYLQKHQL